jgi:hypothetical protein
MDIAGPNERPTHIRFQSQEGDCGLQKSHRAPSRDGGAVDILLRGWGLKRMAPISETERLVAVDQSEL